MKKLFYIYLLILTLLFPCYSFGSQVIGGGSTGSGDVTGPSASTDSELPLFSSTTGKIIKRSNTLTGIPKLTSGVVSIATAGTDYENPLTFSLPLVRTVNAITIPLATGYIWQGVANVPTAVDSLHIPTINMSVQTSSIPWIVGTSQPSTFNVNGMAWYDSDGYYLSIRDQTNTRNLLFYPKVLTDTYYAPIAPAASTVVNTPAGNIAAIDVQAAINELDMEKLATSTTFVTDIGAVFDGGASAITTNAKTVYRQVSYTATITNWIVICDVDSSTAGIIVSMYKDAYAEDTLPTTTMCTTGSAPHVTAGAHKVHSAAWDCDVTTITAGDVLAFKVTTAPTASTWCSVSLKLTRGL